MGPDFAPLRGSIPSIPYVHISTLGAIFRIVFASKLMESKVGLLYEAVAEKAVRMHAYSTRSRNHGPKMPSTTKELLGEDNNLCPVCTPSLYRQVLRNLSASLVHTNARYCTLLLSVPGLRDQRFKVKGPDNLRQASLSRLNLNPALAHDHHE